MSNKYGGPPGEHMTFGNNAASHIDAYFEYKNIVGNDDGGQTFSPKEYENYKREVLPMRLKNRVYVAFVNTKGMDCILVGPQTQCFCQHRYHEHQTDFKELPSTRPILLPCKVKGCPCSSFSYVPKNGSQSIRCGCKHVTDDHKAGHPFNCLKAGCKCTSFKSSYTCNCGEPCYKHETLVETKSEREARGHPVGEDVPYQAMGGITGFSSLAEGYLRLDPSGRGRPDDEFFKQPISHNDHPFIKQYAQHDLVRNSKGELVQSNEAKSAERRQGESELDYFERRYKERMKAEKTSKPKAIQSKSPYDSDAKLAKGKRQP